MEMPLGMSGAVGPRSVYKGAYKASAWLFQVLFTLYLSRRSTFYLMNIILPCTLLSVPVHSWVRAVPAWSATSPPGCLTVPTRVRIVLCWARPSPRGCVPVPRHIAASWVPCTLLSVPVPISVSYTHLTLPTNREV